MTTGSAARRLMWPALVLGLGIATASDARERSGTKAATILTEQSRDVAITRVGVPVEIRLRSQPGTGFSWVPKTPSPFLSAMAPIRGDRAVPGGSQIERFRFVSSRPGMYRLTFSYDQPWRGGTKGARATTFAILVR